MYLQEQPVASSKMICARLHTAGSECDRNTSSARLRSLHPRAIVPSMAASPGSSGLSKTSDILETSQFPFQEQLFSFIGYLLFSRGVRDLPPSRFMDKVHRVASVQDSESA